MKIPRQHMPEQPAEERRGNFHEVNRGLTVLGATTEAMRCLECAKPHCAEGCPVNVDIRDFVRLVSQGDYLAAAAKIREDNVLPAITGRVCPQETQCEGCCILGGKFEPLGIGYLERFVADYEREHGQVGLPPKAPPTGKKVGIVGSGPAGLSAAGDLVRQGHAVTVFEALHEIGGVLLYGIPEFRLPKEIVRQEVNVLRQMGIDFQTNVVIGKTVTIDELMTEEGYDAILIATGAGLPKFLGVPGEHLDGVYSANEFLTRVNLMRGYDPAYDEPVFDCRGKDIAVVGGGNTAMDAVRTACRLGARTSYLIYRRSEKEMPARAEEARHAKDEGIEFRCLTNPVAFLGDDKGRLRGGALHPDGAGRAGRVGPALARADPRLGVRAADRDGRHRAGHRRQPARAVHDARPADQPQGLHRGRPEDAGDLEARRVRGGRHRHRRRDRDPGHGRGPQGGAVDSCVLVGVVRATSRDRKGAKRKSLPYGRGS